MPWPSLFWSRTPKEDDDTSKTRPVSDAPPEKGVFPAEAPLEQAADAVEKALDTPFWSQYAIPATVVATAAATVAGKRFYSRYLRRIPTLDHIKPNEYRRRSLYGYVTSVGDGDNFHLFHTPGGRWLGWGWLPGRKVHEMKKFRGQTIHVRLAGVDAPERPHFGRAEQKYSQEALDWLRSFLLHRSDVRAYLHSRDQYGRAVCTVFRGRIPFFKVDVGYAMLKKGLATVYEAKAGGEYGGMKEKYLAAEAKAKRKKVGMWQAPSLMERFMGKQTPVETPREYKTRYAAEERKGSDAIKGEPPPATSSSDGDNKKRKTFEV
jgi:endonuclease YncB( thermonuclease family)